MRNAFPGHFANDPQLIRSLWEDGLVVVDANVLLGLYRYSDGTRSAFLEVFNKLKDRLWISNQVAKEYLKNRLKVISDQAKTYDAAIQGLLVLRGDFENPKQHPFVSLEVLGDCTRSFDVIIGELRSNKELHDSKINNDDIKESVSKIFEGKVGVPYSQDKLEEIIKDGAERYANKIPPGFKDMAKSGGGSLEERLAPYGDYIGWLQLLDKAKADNLSVIFVTGDNKEDWWLKKSGRTIGPLPELIEEFISVTSKQFYMYLPERFLQQAGEYLKQEISEQAVDEVRETRNERREQDDIQNEFSNKIHRIFWDNKVKLANILGIGAEDLKSDNIVALLSNGDFSEKDLPLEDYAQGLNYKLFQLNAEANQRLVGSPTLQYAHVDDSLLYTLIDQTYAELDSVTKRLESLRSLMAGKRVD